MKIQSQRAKDIKAHLDSHPDAEVGKWQLEIGGQKQILTFYRFPIKLLLYNVDNGRMVMEVREWEEKNKRKLDASVKKDAKRIRKILLGLDPEKTRVLKEDLHQKGQMEPGVITQDGIVINGNRRMALLEDLHKEESTGKWEYLEAVRLPATISEKDLWKIEAGLQLSKDKVAEYHPVNELLKIKQGIQSGLSPQEVAAAMYGRTKEEVEDSVKRLEIIDNFLKFFVQPGNYGFIKKFGLHEYFIDIQKQVVATVKREGLPKKELAKRLQYAFALIRASILIQTKETKKKKKTKPITHWDIRRLGKIFPDAHAKDAYLEHLGKAKNILNVTPETVIDDFRNAVEVLAMRDDRDQPVRLIKKAIKALESIDRESKHFHKEQVKEAIANLSQIVQDIEQSLSVQ